MTKGPGERWGELLAAERKAFDEMLETQNKLAVIFNHYGAPSMALIDEAEAKIEAHDVCKAAVRRFLAEYRADQSK